MQNGQTNAHLAGSDDFLSNSKTGSVFDTLLEDDFGNSVFLLDEVDKGCGRMEFAHLGANRIYWLLTSNDVAPTPAPIMSRIRCFDIPPPTSAQAEAILNNIYHAVQREGQLPVATRPLSPDVFVSLGQVAPRRQRQILREAIGQTLPETTGP